MDGGRGGYEEVKLGKYNVLKYKIFPLKKKSFRNVQIMSVWLEGF